MSDERIQFCRDDIDITSDMYASDDADEVRVWSGDGVRAAFGRDGDGTWSYSGSDYGSEPQWPTDATYSSWQEAFDAFGLSH